MSKGTDSVTINGRQYDQATGMPIDAPISSAHPPSKQGASAAAMHQRHARSKTLNRRYAKGKVQPSDTAKSSQAAHAVPVHTISKFHKPTPAAPEPADLSPTTHPMVQAVHAARATKAEPKRSVPKPSDIIKAEAIQRALDQSIPTHKRHRTKSEKRTPSASRRFSLASAGVGLLLLAGYFTYLNMPNLSVRIAAAEAGVSATYPSYRPAGYSLKGPVAYDNGSVSMQFASNGGPQNFTLTQTRSSWDSSTVLENYVIPRAGSDYAITQDSGLTVYTFGENAVWVSGGVLHTLEGNVQLSNDQVRRIAVSM